MDGKDIKLILGSSIREVRTYKKLTQDNLAELIGMQINTVNRIETGSSFVTSETYAKLCNALEVHPSILLTARPNLILKEHIEYVKEINQLLQTFSVSKLKDAYNILSVMNK